MNASLAMIGLLLAGSLIPFLRTPAWVSAERPESAGLTFYQRRAPGQEARDEPVRVLVVGDILLGRGVSLEERPLQYTSGLLRKADITVGNFEGALASLGSRPAPVAGESGEPPYRLTADPRAPGELQRAGFDLVTLANNHSLDEGEQGLQRTVSSLESAGIRIVGAGNSREAAFRPVTMTTGGVRIAFLAMNGISYPGYGGVRDPAGWQIADWDLEQMKESISSVRSEVQAVVVLVHWGDEYEPRAGPSQRRLAQALVEGGADAVIGSHAHTIQESEVYAPTERPGSPGFIAYGLGNFVFDQYDDRTRLGMALELEIDRASLAAVRSLLVHAGPRPKWVEAGQAISILEKLRPDPETIAFECSRATCQAREAVEMVGDGTFKEGRLDLTGDGSPETVVRQGDRLRIYQDGALAWESEADWKVLDAALGDPNDDGRGEVLLALLKPDSSGELRSHPFVIGYRGGIFRQVWGGSAVRQPILEVELDDLDGDGAQELIVLEERGAGLRGLSVWRWNDWVFSQVWASAAEALEGLRLYQEPGQTPLILTGRIW